MRRSEYEAPLTARMSLMFMTSVIAVLTVAGLSFNMLSQHHFKMLDRQALVEKERIPLEPVPQELQQLVAAIRSERYE